MKSKRIGSFLVSAAVLMTVNSQFVSINVCADDGTSGEKTVEVSGQLFQFDEKNDYEITGSAPVGAADKSNAVGTLSVSGMLTELTSEGNVPVYEIANSSDPDKPIAIQ